MIPTRLNGWVPRLPYIVVYEVDRARARILVTGVFHGAQNRDGTER